MRVCHPPHPSYLGRGSLTEEQVLDIRESYYKGWKSAAMLARKYNKTPGAIFGVIQGSTYRWAGGPIVWPGDGANRKLTFKVRGRCNECSRPISDFGWAQRMHLCDECFSFIGKKCGRPRSGWMANLTCKICRKKFQYYIKDSGYRPKCCSQACGAVLSAKKRSKRPKALTADVLYDMYWGQNLTMPEIVAKLRLRVHWSVVRNWLMEDGTSRRASNWRTHTCCIVENCGQPIHYLKQQDGRPYGRLCKEHHNEREARNARIQKEELAEAQGAGLTEQANRLLVGLPESVKTDALQEIVVAVLSCELALPLTRESVKPFITRAFKENADAWKFLSLAAPTREEEGSQTWGERLGLL